MKVEVKGVEFSNKGAELMLVAVVQALKQFRPDWQLVLTPGHLLPYPQRAALGAWQKFSFRLLGMNWTFLGNLMPANIQRLMAHFGIVAERQIDVVFDASGFVYSDKWGSERLKSTLNQLKRMAKHHARYVFLPQAFGPFEQPRNARLMAQIAAKATFLCARDEVSFDSVKGVCPLQHQHKIARFSDMTTLVDVSEVTLEFALPSAFIVIVPNAKMFWRKGGEQKSRYLEFITQAVYAVRHLGFTPLIINHEGEKDRKMCQQLVADIELASGEGVLFVDGLNALQVKKIIGLARLCLSSRFHGCVSSLSQGVPTLATSWGHKYEQLFAEYECQDMVVAIEQGGLLTERMSQLLSDDQLSSRLRDCGERQKAQTAAMWQTIFGLIDHG